MMQQTLTPAAPLVGSPPKTMSEPTFEAIRSYIYDLTGIYFQDNKKYLLEGRISKRLQMTGAKTYEEYLSSLKRIPGRNGEHTHLFEAVTINETFFFRNEPQFDALETTLVPAVLGRQSGRKKLRIWSAASSSGEEAYTLAMIYLDRLRPRYPGLEIEIVGTDINQSVLETARRGVFRDYAIRNVPPALLKKYFVTDAGRHTLSDEVRRHVRFEFLNLFDQNGMRAMQQFDIIFCCNVLIYFDAKSKAQVISSLYNGLARGGYLFVGYAETLHGITSAFKLVNFPKTVAYMKD